MDSAIQLFVRHLGETGASTSTVLAYQTDLEQLEKFLGNRWNQITQTDIDGYLSHLKSEYFKKATQSRKIVSLRRFFTFLEEAGLVTTNPTSSVKSVAVIRDKRTPLSTAEIHRLCAQPNISTALGLRDRVMLELVLTAGLSSSELVELTLDDVGINNHLVTLNISGKGTLARVVTSTSPNLASLLNDYLVERSRLAKSTLEVVLILNNRGVKLSRQGAFNTLRNLGLKAGLLLNPRTLRSTYADQLIKAGYTYEQIQQRLGHRMPSSTKILAGLLTA